MSLIKCECGLRIRPKFLAIHQKNCIKRKKVLRRAYLQSITQSLEYRRKTLSIFSNINIDEYNLDKMSDIQFNDLVSRLELLQEEKFKKEKELELKLQFEKKELERKELEAKELEKKDIERKSKEEFARIEQIKRVSEREKEIINKKERLENTFIEKREEEISKIKTKEQVIKEEIENIDSLINKTVKDIPELDSKQIEKPIKKTINLNEVKTGIRSKKVKK